jgi:hypothetical protein
MYDYQVLRAAPLADNFPDSHRLVKIHGTHRGVLLVEFLDVPWG